MHMRMFICSCVSCACLCLLFCCFCTRALSVECVVCVCCFRSCEEEEELAQDPEPVMTYTVAQPSRAPRRARVESELSAALSSRACSR